MYIYVCREKSSSNNVMSEHIKSKKSTEITLCAFFPNNHIHTLTHIYYSFLRASSARLLRFEWERRRLTHRSRASRSARQHSQHKIAGGGSEEKASANSSLIAEREAYLTLIPSYEWMDGIKAQVQRNECIKRAKIKKSNLTHVFAFAENNESKKCRARFGVDNQSQWCKHCKRKVCKRQTQ